MWQLLRRAVAKVRTDLRGVRAWNGIPGIDVQPAFAARLQDAKVPVTVYTIEAARRVQKQRGFVARASWGSAPGADFNTSPPDGIIGGGPEDAEVIPAKMGYRVATPLARLEPDADLAIWVARNFEPDELAATYRLQEGDWLTYLREMRAEAEGQPTTDASEGDDWDDWFKENK